MWQVNGRRQLVSGRTESLLRIYSRALCGQRRVWTVKVFICNLMVLQELSNEKSKLYFIVKHFLRDAAGARVFIFLPHRR